ENKELGRLRIDKKRRWGYGSGYENLPDYLLFRWNRNSLLVCTAIFLDSRGEFWAVRRRDFCDENFQLFCGGFDSRFGDFSRLVVSRCSREEDCRMVDRAALEFGCGIVARVAAVFAQEDGLEVAFPLEAPRRLFALPIPSAIWATVRAAATS